MKELDHSPLLTIDTLLRTLMMAGAILVAALIVAHPNSWAMKIAAITLVLGFLAFTLALQFLITLEMEGREELDKVGVNERAKDPRLAFPCLFGNFAYIVAGVFLCIHFIIS